MDRIMSLKYMLCHKHWIQRVNGYEKIHIAIDDRYTTILNNTTLHIVQQRLAKDKDQTCNQQKAPHKAPSWDSYEKSYGPLITKRVKESPL